MFSLPVFYILLVEYMITSLSSHMSQIVLVLGETVRHERNAGPGRDQAPRFSRGIKRTSMFRRSQIEFHGWFSRLMSRRSSDGRSGHYVGLAIFCSMETKHGGVMQLR